MKSFRFTGDDRRFLWDKGGAIMSVVNAQTLEFIDYENFWQSKDKKKPIRSAIGLATSDCSKIFGAGYQENVQMLVLQKSSGERVYKSTSSTEYSGKISSWLCCESSVSADYFFVGGVNLNTPTIGAISFNENLAPLGFLNLNKTKSRSLSKLKRIEGSEILIAGMVQDILILRVVPPTDLTILYSFTIFTEFECVSLAFHSNFIYTLCSGETVLHVIELKKPIVQEECMKCGKLMSDPRDESYPHAVLRRPQGHQRWKVREACQG